VGGGAVAAEARLEVVGLRGRPRLLLLLLLVVLVVLVLLRLEPGRLLWLLLL